MEKSLKTIENATWQNPDDDDWKTADGYEIFGIPAIVMLDDEDNILQKHIGFLSSAKLKKFLSRT